MIRKIQSSTVMKADEVKSHSLLCPMDTVPKVDKNSSSGNTHCDFAKGKFLFWGFVFLLLACLLLAISD